MMIDRIVSNIFELIINDAGVEDSCASRLDGCEGMQDPSKPNAASQD